MQAFETMPDLTKATLEDAARQYFEKLKAEVAGPIVFDDYEPSDGIAMSIEHSRDRMKRLDHQLQLKDYDPDIVCEAEALLSKVGTLDQASQSDRLTASELAARAERERLVYLIHRLRSPVVPYQAYDTFFRPVRAGMASEAHAPVVDRAPSVKLLADDYIVSKTRLGRSRYQVEDTVRVLRWLGEEVGPDRSMAAVTKAELRKFRDDLIRLPKDGRGQSGAFADRLIGDPDSQVAEATAQRYWGFVRAFFRWATSEGHIDMDPIAGVRMDRRSNAQGSNSPEPFSQVELERIILSPLYSGHARKRYSISGPCSERGGHWWSGLLLMHTGMRAGELAQLEPEDFVFDDPIPHLIIRKSGRQGRTAKSLRTPSAARRIPLAVSLLDLGIEAFVRSRLRRDRVFFEFDIRASRASDAISKFWHRYLKGIGLWKSGRSTHVWRHTFVANLRKSGVSDQDIAAVVGHTQTGETSRYGGEYALERKKATIDRLDFGFDAISLLQEGLSGGFRSNGN